MTCLGMLIFLQSLVQSKASAALVFFFPATPTVRRTCLARTSLYTDVVLFFFSKTSTSENEREAREDFLFWRRINPIPCGLYFLHNALQSVRCPSYRELIVTVK